MNYYIKTLIIILIWYSGVCCNGDTLQSSSKVKAEIHADSNTVNKTLDNESPDKKSGTKINLMSNLLSGFIGALILLFLSEIWGYFKEKKAEKLKYINLLLTTKDELDFYKSKLKDLMQQINRIILELNDNNRIAIPTFSFYPSFIEKLKEEISSYQFDSELIVKITICHYELEHISDRLNLNKNDLRQDYDAATLTTNLRGFNVLIEKGINDYEEAINTIIEIISRRKRWIY